MALIPFFFQKKPLELPPLTLEIPRFTQKLLISSEAQEQFNKNRQLSRGSKEAGGQLFGRITADVAAVLLATGPYPGDHRTRNEYRSSKKSAQKMIDAQAAQNLLYLGEWHTHPECHPNPSPSDIEAMRTLHAKSSLNLNKTLLIIVGTCELPQSLAVFYFENDEMCKIYPLRQQS